MSMVSTISVLDCTFIINPAPLFHNVQNLEWFVQPGMIFNYNAECIFTTLNDLYYVEWVVLSWIICICNVEWVFDYVERLAVLLNDFGGLTKLSIGKYHPENYLKIFSPMKIPTMIIVLSENFLCGNFLSYNWFLTNEKTDYRSNLK